MNTDFIFFLSLHFLRLPVNVSCVLSQAKLEEQFQLTGSNAYAARFGESIADLGDLDDDGYPGRDHTPTDLEVVVFFLLEQALVYTTLLILLQPEVLNM